MVQEQPASANNIALGHDAALIVVDLQEDFCEPGGALAVKGGREVASGINELLLLPFSLKIATQDYHPSDHCSFASQHPDAAPFTSVHIVDNPEATDADVETQEITLWPDHCVQRTTGAELVPELDRAKLSYIIKKGEDKRVESYSAFGPPFRRPAVGMSRLEAILHQADIKRVYICGLAFDYCVKHTAEDAARAGFEAFVVEDLTRPVDAENTESVYRDLSKQGVQLIQKNAFVSLC